MFNWSPCSVGLAEENRIRLGLPGVCEYWICVVAYLKGHSQTIFYLAFFGCMHPYYFWFSGYSLILIQELPVKVPIFTHI